MKFGDRRSIFWRGLLFLVQLVQLAHSLGVDTLASMPIEFRLLHKKSATMPR